jgi:hypothetical protein
VCRWYTPPPYFGCKVFARLDLGVDFGVRVWTFGRRNVTWRVDGRGGKEQATTNAMDAKVYAKGAKVRV